MRGNALVVDAIRKPYDVDQIATRNENAAKIRDDKLRLPKNTTRSKLPIRIAVIHKRIV